MVGTDKSSWRRKEAKKLGRWLGGWRTFSGCTKNWIQTLRAPAKWGMEVCAFNIRTPIGRMGGKDRTSLGCSGALSLTRWKAKTDNACCPLTSIFTPQHRHTYTERLKNKMKDTEREGREGWRREIREGVKQDWAQRKGRNEERRET